MDRLPIADLRNQLEALGLETMGTKAELLQRLASLQNPSPDVDPQDSVSNASGTTCKSKASSTHSLRLSRAAESAKKAGLLAKAEAIKQKQKQDELILKAQQAKELLEIEAEIQAADARETVLREAEKEFTNNDLGAIPKIRILNPTTEDTSEQTAIYHLPPLPHLPQNNQLNVAAAPFVSRTAAQDRINSDPETPAYITETHLMYSDRHLSFQFLKTFFYHKTSFFKLPDPNEVT